jgi:hypothetical protein
VASSEFRIAIFSPAPLVGDWAEILASIPKTYPTNVQVDFLHCSGFQVNNCLTKKALLGERDVSPVAMSILCGFCRSAQPLTHDNIARIPFDSFVTAEIEEKVSLLLQNRNGLGDFEADGIPVGRYASFDELLRQKATPETLVESELLNSDLKNFLLTYFGMASYILDRKPDSISVLNASYAVNRAVEQAAIKFGVQIQYLLGGGSPRQATSTFYVMPSPQFLRGLPKSDGWKRSSEVALSKSQVALVGLDLAAKIQGTANVSYTRSSRRISDAKLEVDVRNRRSKYPLGKVVLVPLTSPDEFDNADFVYGSRTKANQEEKIGHLFKWAEELPDWTFIVRPHPRMLPNPRDRISSPLIHRLKKLLSNRPLNVLINDPSNGNSAYRLGQLVDAVLGYRSSLPVEMQALGIPTLVFEPEEVDTFPADIQNGSILTSQDLVRELKLLDGSRVVIASQLAFRWLYYLNHGIAWKTHSYLETLDEKMDSREKGVSPTSVIVTSAQGIWKKVLSSRVTFLREIVAPLVVAATNRLVILKKRANYSDPQPPDHITDAGNLRVEMSEIAENQKILRVLAGWDTPDVDVS